MVDFKTQQIRQAGVYPLGLVNLDFDLYIDREQDTKNATIAAHFDNGAQHLSQRFFFFDRSKFGPGGYSLRNSFVQLLYAGLAPEPLFPLLEVFNQSQGGGMSEKDQEELTQKITDAHKEAIETIREKQLGWPKSVEDVEDWAAYIDGGKITNDEGESVEFPGWSSMLVDKIYAVYLTEVPSQKGTLIVVPQNKKDLAGLPFVILPLWWGPGTGVQSVDPDYKLPYSNMTPEEWVAHSKDVRAEIQASKKSWGAKIDEGGYNVLQQFGRLGFGGGGGGGMFSDSDDEPSSADSDDDDEDAPPF